MDNDPEYVRERLSNYERLTLKYYEEHGIRPEDFTEEEVDRIRRRTEWARQKYLTEYTHILEIEKLERESNQLKFLESATQDIDERRQYRDDRWKLEKEIHYISAKNGIYNMGENTKYLDVKLYRFSEKLIYFLSNVYLGPLYGNIMYDEDEIGNPLQEYLYFLNPEDPFYCITNHTVISRLISIYLKINRINTINITPARYSSVKDDQIRTYFMEEYEKASSTERGPNSRILFVDGYINHIIINIIIDVNKIHRVKFVNKPEKVIKQYHMSYMELKQILKKIIPLEEALMYSKSQIEHHPEARDSPNYDQLSILNPYIKAF